MYATFCNKPLFSDSEGKPRTLKFLKLKCAAKSSIESMRVTVLKFEGKERIENIVGLTVA